MFKFEYDQWYRTRDGDNVRIVAVMGQMVLGSNGYQYSQSPTGNQIYDHVESGWDLVEHLPSGPRSNGPYQLGVEHARKRPNIAQIADNPYPRDSTAHSQWRSGFLAGMVS